MHRKTVRALMQRKSTVTYNKDMETRLHNNRDGVNLLIFLAFVLTLCVLSLVFSGCKTKYITTEVPVIVHERDSIYKVNTLQVHDTLMMRDSVYHYVKGDTTIIERWHQLQAINHIARVDTIVQIQEKEVPVTVTKTEVVEVEKKLSWWQKTLMWIGGILLTFGGIRIWWWFKHRRA